VHQARYGQNRDHAKAGAPQIFSESGDSDRENAVVPQPHIQCTRLLSVLLHENIAFHCANGTRPSTAQFVFIYEKDAIYPFVRAQLIMPENNFLTT
jgi:hypothetical protein